MLKEYPIKYSSLIKTPENILRINSDPFMSCLRTYTIDPNAPIHDIHGQISVFKNNI